MLTTQEKRAQSVRNRYGVENVAQLAEVQNKRRAAFDAKRTALIFYQPPITNIIRGDQLQPFRINKEVADAWLNKYHPFKAPRGNVLCLGLTDGDEIYCLMTFKRSRDHRYNAEISRMWMLPGCKVIDGYDILSKIASDLGLYNLVAYVNLSFENYQDYEAIGMKFKRNIQKTRWWIHKDERMSDASRRQKHITEHELIFQGWIPVYDCGQAVYEYI